MDKEATVYIIDQGKSMGKIHNGREEDDLSFSLRYIWDKITATIQAERKTYCLGIVGVRTDGTSHGVAANDESYHHISIHQELKGPYLLADLREAQQKIRVSTTDRGDVISAIVVAFTMIDKFAPSRLKYNRKIVLVTNATGHIDGDDLDAIASKLNEANIELVVLGVDFDDAEYGYKEEDKDPRKADNEKVLQSLCDKCETKTFGTMAEAVEELDVPRLKISRPYSNYKGPLWLGNPDLGAETAMVIQVERYFRTKRATAPSASTFVKAEVSSNETNDLDEDTNMGGVSADGLAAVKSNTTYSVVDLTADGQKRELKREELAKGYMYGRTAVPISASEEDVTKLDTDKEFTIIGFVPSENYPKYFNMETSCMTIATQLPGSTRDKMALSSFIHGLAETDSYAVARMVEKEKKSPAVLLLAPWIEPDGEALIDIVLPFQEDLRLYRFPALDHVLTVSGTVLTKHRHLPTDELTKAMSAYVDSMDLSNIGTDEEGNATEYFTIDDNFKPDLHRISQGIRHRAAYPDEPIPPIPNILVKYRHPLYEAIVASRESLAKLIKVADVKAVPEKVKGAGKGQAAAVPKSGLDVTALLTRKPKITPENAIPEFKQYLSTTTEIDVGVEKAVKQFTPIIRDIITNPLPQYERVKEHLKVLKQEMIDNDRADLYNSFMMELKKDIWAGKLGGERKDLWFEIGKKSEGLGLVVGTEKGEVTEEVARKCMSMTMEDDAAESIFG